MDLQFNEDLLFGVATRERLDMEARMTLELGTPRPHWWAAIMRQDGHVVIETNYPPSEFEGPDISQQEWAIGNVKFLNREISHDGAWIIAFTHPPENAEQFKVTPDYNWRRIVKLFMDRDGDIQFSTENMEPFHIMYSVGPHHYAQQSEEAYQKWKELMRSAMAPKTHQLVNLAQIKQRGTA